MNRREFLKSIAGVLGALGLAKIAPEPIEEEWNHPVLWDWDNKETFIIPQNDFDEPWPENLPLSSFDKELGWHRVEMEGRRCPGQDVLVTRDGHEIPVIALTEDSDWDELAYCYWYRANDDGPWHFVHGFQYPDGTKKRFIDNVEVDEVSLPETTGRIAEWSL